MDVYANYGITIPNGKYAGEVQTTCPQCSHTRKKKTDKCLSINLDKRVWRCNHCEWRGYLKTEKEVKTYVKPVWKNNTQLSEKLVKWFEKRGIRQNTLLDARITEGWEYMPQIQKECNTAQFNYFKDDVLINVKYRSAEKHFKLFKDAELIFYNLDGIKDQRECYIVEGEMDALSFIEAGLKNVVSVPNGANLNTNNLAYLDNCIDYFANMDLIHLAVDNDIAGRKLRDELAERFGKYRTDYIEFKDCKDANECLQKYGINGIIESIGKPIKFPLEGIFTISDIDYDINDMYENGLDKGLDLKIDGFDLTIAKGYITTITGIPSHGKSDWVDNMCLHARMNGNWSGAFYSPENKPTQLHFSKMARKLIGKHWDGNNRINDVELRLAKEYLDRKMWFLKPEKDFSLTSILNMVRDLQQRYGIDYFTIDAWNKLDNGNDDTYLIGKHLDQLAMFSEDNKIACFLVAHPRKMPKGDNGKYNVPTLYDIKGSSTFYDKTDNGIAVYRDFDLGLTTIYRQKIKFDHWGTEGFSEYTYDKISKRYIHNGNVDNVNWITKMQVQPSINFNQMPVNNGFLDVKEWVGDVPF
jgi:twinkle protein